VIKYADSISENETTVKGAGIDIFPTLY